MSSFTIINPQQKNTNWTPPVRNVDEKFPVNWTLILSLLIEIIIIIITIIIITRPKPAYGRHGLAGSWGQDTDEVNTFLVFLTSHFAPAALSSDLTNLGSLMTMKIHLDTLKNHGNQPKTMKNHEATMKNHGNQPKTMKNHETTLKTMETNQKP